MRQRLRVPPGSTIEIRLKAAKEYARQERAPFTPETILAAEFLQLSSALEVLETQIRLDSHWPRLIQVESFQPKAVELYAIALLAASRLQVTDAEPDAQVVIGGQRVSVACKCVASPKRIIPAIVDARRQIEKHCYPGFVLIDLGQIVPPAKFPRPVRNDDEWYAFAKVQMADVLRECGASSISKMLKGTLAKSVVFRLSRVAPIMVNGQPTLSTLDYFPHLSVRWNRHVETAVRCLSGTGLKDRIL